MDNVKKNLIYFLLERILFNLWLYILIYINEKNVHYKIHFVTYYFNIVLKETYWNMLLLMIVIYFLKDIEIKNA